MGMSFSSVDIDEVDWRDETFLIPAFSSDERLETSLGRFGLLSPPWLLSAAAGRFVIIDGFKRLGLLRKRDVREVGCLVFPEDFDRNRLLLMRIEGKLFGAPLNGAEKAWIVSRLAAVVPTDEMLARHLPALDIPAKREVLDRWLRLAAAGARLMESLATEKVQERAALELAEWEEDAREEALTLLTDLGCSSSIQMEILERTAEIALREDVQKASVLRESEILEVLRDPRSNRRQKTQSVRDFLARRRYPRLKAKEELLQREMAELSLPKSIRVGPPPSFEGDRWRMEFGFSSPQELERLLGEARAFADSEKLRSLLALASSGEKKDS